MRTRRIALTILIAGLVACTGSADPTTTSLTTSTTGVTTSTPTTAATTTTSTNPETTTSTDADNPADIDWFQLTGEDFPADPATVEDVPAVFADLVGQPAPDPDLTITGPDDAEKWVGEWLTWSAWLGANPQQGIDQVAEGWIPDAPQGQGTIEGLEQLGEGRRFSVPFSPISVSGSFDEAFDNGQFLLLVVRSDNRIPAYTVDASGTVVEVRPSDEDPVDILLSLRPDEEGEWRVEQIDVQS